MTMLQTMVALGGLIVVIATMMMANVLWAGGVLVVEAGVLYLVTTKDKHGMSLLDKGAERLRFRRAARCHPIRLGAAGAAVHHWWFPAAWGAVALDGQ